MTLLLTCRRPDRGSLMNDVRKCQSAGIVRGMPNLDRKRKNARQDIILRGQERPRQCDGWNRIPNTPWKWSSIRHAVALTNSGKMAVSDRGRVPGTRPADGGWCTDVRQMARISRRVSATIHRLNRPRTWYSRRRSVPAIEQATCGRMIGEFSCAECQTGSER